MPTQQGFSHMMLTVTDAAESAAWYRDLLGGDSAYSGKDDHGPLEVVVSGSLMIGFRTHARTGGTDRFDETRVGLDHVAFATTATEIETWRTRLEERGVPNSGIIEDPFGKHLNFKDPDGIALELYVPVGT